MASMRSSGACATALLLLLSAMPAVHAGMYGEHVVELDSSNFDKLVMDSADTWLVKFYAPWCGHCKSSAPAFSKAAKKLHGVARLGVVNCDDDKSLAGKYGVSGFPTIKVFKGEGRKQRRPSDFSGERTAKAFVDHAKYVMPSFVARVKPSGIDAYFADLKNLPHILLFTDKSSTSPLFKGLSARFRGKLAFGEVRKADAGKLLKKYSVGSFPKLVAFKPSASDLESAEVHSGEMDPTTLTKFFESIAEGATPESDVTDSGEEAKKETVFVQPKAYAGGVDEVTSTKAYRDTCGFRKDGRMCGLAFLPGGLKHALIDDLKAVAQQYQYDNLAFAVVDSNSDGGMAFAKLFDVSPEKGGFIAMRARKSKYASLDAEVALEKSTISSFLDRIVGGDARYKKLTAELPVWEEPVADGDKTADAGENDVANDTEHSEDGKCGTEPPKDGGTCGGDKDDL